MKKYLLNSITAYISLTFAFVRRMNMLTAIFLLCMSTAFAATRTQITAISVGTQNGTATYGTAANGGGAINYTIGLTKNNFTTTNAQQNDVLSISWAAGAAPAGVTTSFPFTYNPATIGANTTLTISTTGLTPAGTYTFTILNTDNNGATTPTKTGTLLVSARPLSINGSDVTKVYGTTLTSGTVTAGFASTGLVNGDLVNSITITYGTGSAATATVAGGPYTNQVSASNAAGTFVATNYNITYNSNRGDITVSKAPLTITGLTAVDKVYTNTTPATLAGTGILNGVLAADIGRVTLTGTPTANFVNENVGNQAVTVTGYTLGGTAAGNYTVTQPTGLSANITPKALTITGADANNKTYDGTTAATLIGTLTGILAGDAVTLNKTGTFATANIGTNITVTSTATISGTSAGNYTLTQPVGINANITAKALTVTGLVAHNKVYDGTTAATLTGTGVLNGVIAGDAVTLVGTPTGTFTSANANNNVPITVTGYSLGGLSQGNYTFTEPTGLNADITGAPLTITATGLPATKNYGVTQNFVNNSTNFTITSGTLISGQTVTTVSLSPDIIPLLNPYTAAGSNYTITPSNAAGTNFNPDNYNITYVGFTGKVVPAPITVTATGPAKVYGTALTNINNSTTNYTVSGSMAPGESIVNVDLAPSGPGIAANAAVGTAYTVTPSGATDILNILGFINVPISISNYTVTYVNFTGGTVTPAPLTIAAAAVSKPFGSTLASPATGSTAFTPTGLKNGETIGSVTLTYGAAAAAGAAVGPYTNQVTPSAATGGTFTASNYTITYTSNTLTVVTGIYDWTGAVSTDWATGGNWNVNGVQQTTNYPGSAATTDMVQIGVIAYTANQPIIGVTPPNSITSLTFGAATAVKTLTLNTSASLTVSGNTVLNTGTQTVTLSGTGSSLNLNGNFTTNTGSTFNNNSSATITIGGNLTNGGTSNFGTPLLTFNSASTTLLTTSTPLTFTNVNFSGNSTKSLKSGNFIIASTGILTMGGTSTILDAGAGGSLTLLSDATGSASVDAIPTGCKINGQVSVQRYLSAQRSYRLLSSPVNTGTTTPTANYNLNYVKNSVYLTGTNGTIGGFDKVSGPTLYLYKENYSGPGNTFTTSNFRDITDITAAPLYSIDGETGTFSLPTGSTFMMYFRGDRAKGTLDQETTAGFAATSATLTATGVLNQGTITFTDLFSGTAALSSSNTNPAMQGFNGIGNPYASSIDLETLGTGIVAPGITKFIYEFNQITQAFDIYTVNGTSTNPIPPTGNAGRYIASGQGFMVNGSGTLSMNESAKAATVQNTGVQLLMGKPATQLVNAQYLRLQMARDTNTTSDIIISFSSTSKATFSPAEDALFRAGGSAIIFSSISSDNRSLAINQLPLAQKNEVIRLNVSGSAGTPYTLNIKDFKGIPDEYDLWLMDADKKDSLDLRVNKSYPFTMVASDTGSYGAYRFSIVLRQNPAKAYKLISFDASKTTNKDVQLVWVTQNEENYTNFTVERSVNNGKTYDVVGGTTSTGAGTYSLIDKRPSDHNLYRLKQEDINDSITYSNVVKIDFSNRGNDQYRNVNVYPNPARDRVTFAIESQGQFYKSPTYKIEITNAWGLILQQTTSKDAEWQTNVGRFMPGTYYVRVVNEKDGSLVGQNKFVKL